MSGTTYLKLFYDLEDTAVKMSDSDAGQLLKALLHYGRTGEDISPDSPIADIVYGMVKNQIDRDQESYKFGSKGGRPSKKTGVIENENPPFEKAKPPFDKDKDKEEDKEEDKDEDEDDKTTTGGGTRAREEETPFGTVTIDPLIVKVQREIVGMTDTHYDLFRQYRDDLGDELVSYAIDSAVAQGVRKWAYLETILCRYETARYKTVAEVKAAEEERKTRAAPQKPPKTVTAQRFTQREYTNEQLDGEMSPLLAEMIRKVKDEDGMEAKTG